MKKFCALFLTVCSLFLCGCWDGKEPSRLAMVTCVVMDVDEEDTYTVYTELLDTMMVEATEPPEGKKSFHSNTGKTFVDAVHEANNDLGRELFGGVNKIRIFSQRFAERGFIDTIDFFLRAPYTDETPYLIIYKNDDIKEFFETKPTMDTLYGTYFENLALSEMKDTSESGSVHILDFVKDYMTEGKQPVAGVLESVATDLDPKEKKFLYEGLAVFKGGNLVGYLDRTQTRSYNVITGKAKGIYQTVQLESGEVISASSEKCKSKIKVEFKDGRATAEIKVKIMMNLTQQPSLLNTDKFDVQHEIEQMFNEKFKEEFEDSVKKVQTEYKSDIFGFGNAVMSKDYNTWLSIRDEWDDKYFPETEVKINVECKIEHSGQINRSLKEKE